jgi:hypothetical protein
MALPVLSTVNPGALSSSVIRLRNAFRSAGVKQKDASDNP